jgi:predicted ester cyclase
MPSEPEVVIRTWFEEVWNQRSKDTIHRLFDAETVAHGLPGGELRGPAGFEPLHAAFCGAFPDIRVAVEHTVTEGDMVVAHVRVTGSNTGEGLGFPPTGRRIDMQGMVLARVVGGRLREGWNCFDFLGMYQQLGVTPPA